VHSNTSYKELWLYYGIVLLLAALYVQTSDYYVQPDLDGGVIWSINEFFSFRQPKAFFYPATNGPLYLLKMPTEKGSHLLVSVLFNLSIRFLLGFFLIKLARVKKINEWTAILVFLFLLSFLNFDFIYIAAIVAGSYYIIKTEFLWQYLPISILITLSFYIKGSISFPGLFVFGSMILILLFHKKYKKVFQLVGIQIFLFLLVNIILYQNPMDGILWVIQSLFDSLSYGSYQAVYFKNFLPLLIPALLLTLMGPFIIKDKDYRLLYFLTLVLIFIFWKYVLGRQDFTHYRAWHFLSLMMLGFSILLFNGKIRILSAGLYFLSFLFFLSNVKRGDSPKPFTINTPNITSFASAILKPQTAKELFIKQSNQWSEEKILSDTILQIIGTQSVDAFPWELSILRKYNLQYKPRPNFYSTLLGPEGDQSDAAHFANSSAPVFILWHNSQPDLFQLNAHNQIYLLNSNPKGIASIVENYEFMLYDNGYALWKKRRLQSKNALNKEKKKNKIVFDKWYAAPLFDSSNTVFGKTNFELPITDKIRSAIYKDRFFKISYKLKNQKTVLHFLSKESLQQGFILQPYFINPRLDFEVVDSIKIIPMNKIFNNRELELSYSNQNRIQ